MAAEVKTPSKLPKIMMAQMNRCNKYLETNSEAYFIPWFDENNPKVWKILVHGLPGDFEGGQYLFTLTAPDDFPHKPPQFSFDTPNGVFSNTAPKICISIGEFHANDKSKDGGSGWRPSMGMCGFIISVVNCMQFFDPNHHGIGIEIGNSKTKKALARESIAYNKKHFKPIIDKIIDHGMNTLPSTIMDGFKGGCAPVKNEKSADGSDSKSKSVKNEKPADRS